MVLSGVQDRLAPWQAWLFPRRVYLEIQDQALTGLALEGDAIGWCETLPLPEGTITAGSPQQPEALGDLIGDWLIERGWAGARVRAVLPWQATAWRRLRWPVSAPAQPLADALPSDLGPQALGGGLEQLDLCLEPGEGVDEALLLAARADLLEAWIAVFAQAGLCLDGLEAAGVCCLRAAAASPARVLLCAEAEQCWLVLLGGGWPRWQWRLPGPSQPADLIEALGPALAYCGRQDPAVMAAPLLLVGSRACGADPQALVAALQGAAAAGVELVDPVGAGGWRVLPHRPLALPCGALGLLWGLAEAEPMP